MSKTAGLVMVESDEERAMLHDISKESYHDDGAIMSQEEVLITRDEDIERASRSIKAMSHPLRLKILCALGDQEVSVQDIVSMVGTSQSNISQHLAILRDKGILASRKDANRVYYRVGDTRTLRLIGMMREVFCSAH
jgi:DNA-binding transcriptional ArsR family regulator